MYPWPVNESKVSRLLTGVFGMDTLLFLLGASNTRFLQVFQRELPPIPVYYGIGMIGDPTSLITGVFLAEWLAIVASWLLWISREGKSSL